MGEEKKNERKRKHRHSKDKEKKRTKSEHTLGAVDVKVESSVPTFLATFPGVSVPEDTTFQAYKGSKENYVIHGETDRMEYDGQNDPDEDIYYVGVYDPNTRTVELMHAPVMNTSRTIKAYKNKEVAAVKQANVQNRVQMTALGEAFGTKKAKKVISDLERNKIEAEKLESYADSIVDNIKTATENLPSAGSLREQQSEERPIPPFNEDADDLNNIYPLEGLLTKEEFGSIRVGAIFREQDEKKRVSLLPFTASEYINNRVARINNENDMQKLKLLYYASLLMGLYNNRRISNKRALLQKLNYPAEILVNGLIEKFTESKVGKVGKEQDASFTITPKKEDRLLCYLFAICLRIDDYCVETPGLTAELSLRPTRVQDLFKALGCKIRPCSSAQKEALGLTAAEAANYKLATLSLPFKLPEVARRKRTAQSRR
ncbi:RNA polymerase I associated factor, A49-like protein [Lipomyces kononenkoae]|uniref:RNA polymerase I associated factor, A49-like protein n=1 Tax=Lipomyces kononenkoae TaxID=34357 RepID=A0ACC3TAZ4_LIPKO